MPIDEETLQRNPGVDRHVVEEVDLFRREAMRLGVFVDPEYSVAPPLGGEQDSSIKEREDQSRATLNASIPASLTP